MEVRRQSLEAAPPSGPCVLTLGNFDGVHAGHRALLREVRGHARRRGLPAVVLSFDPHPSVVVAPERRPRLLMTLEQRLEAFRQEGMDLAWILPFDRALSELPPQVFLERLQAALQPVELHVGKAFRFGRDRQGGLDTLADWAAASGCELHPHALKGPDGGPLSSTRVRQAIAEGRVEEAASLLGHPFTLTGFVVEGERRGRHLGFPTANLAWEQEQLPAKGVYVTEARGPHFDHPRPGLTNVGDKPTFQGVQLTVETHLPHFEGDLYGTRLELAFLHRLRPEQRFEGVDALRARIAEDVLQGVAWYEDHKGGERR